MSFFSLFKKSNSILLGYDKVTLENKDDVLEQIDEIKKYYRCVTLTEFSEKRKSGCAILAFENARRGTFVHILPILISEKVPFTLFLKPQFIGTNRLPKEEELHAYREEYPLLKDSEFLDKPFPVQKTDPFDYFATWGKIKELPPQSFDIGINLENQMFTDDILASELNFIQSRLGRTAHFALARNPIHSSQFKAVVTAREGEIEASTPLLDLPRYSLKKND